MANEKPNRKNPASAENGKKGAPHGIKGKEFGVLGGRPKNEMTKEEMVAHIRAITPALLKNLENLVNAMSDQVRVSATNSLLDRGWGKPETAITGSGGGPVQATVKWQE